MPTFTEEPLPDPTMRTIPAQGRAKPRAGAATPRSDAESTQETAKPTQASTDVPTPFDPWLALSQPFPPALVEVKPGATSEANSRCLALPYVDARHYQGRLDAVAGVTGWNVAYRPWGERAVICALTVLGVTREDVGEAEAGDPNQATSAAMQAFKRACAAFGLGRYLYTQLPQLWADAEKRGKAWAIKDPAAVVRAMYDNAGIDLSKRQAYIGRIRTICEALDEAGLIRVGKCAAGKGGE